MNPAETAFPRVVPYGDAAALVVLGDQIDRGLNRRVHALAADVAGLAAELPGIGPAVPAYASLLVPFDPLATDLDALLARLAHLAGGAPGGAPEPAPGAGTVVEVPTRYGGQEGPDLAEVAAIHGLTEAQVIEAHASVEYETFFLGFAPGFGYLGPVPSSIATPRRPTPRARVPAGSVGIAGRQTGIYPAALPGGWQLIGRTELRLWDPRRDPPALLAPGDRVRFVPLPNGD